MSSVLRSNPGAGTPVAQIPETGDAEANEDVVISIKGLTAARMLARGDAEAARRDELVRALEERLQHIEAALGQRINEQSRLDRQMQELDGRLSLLGDELSKLRTALGNVPDDLSTQRYKLGALQEKVDQLGALQQQVDQLGSLQQKVQQQMGGLQDKSDGLQRSLDGAASRARELQAQIECLDARVASRSRVMATLLVVLPLTMRHVPRASSSTMPTWPCQSASSRGHMPMAPGCGSHAVP